MVRELRHQRISGGHDLKNDNPHRAQHLYHDIFHFDLPRFLLVPIFCLLLITEASHRDGRVLKALEIKLKLIRFL